MFHTVEFVRPTAVRHLPPVRSLRKRRSIGDKLQDLANRSPKDLIALEGIIDVVLARLDAEDSLKPKVKLLTPYDLPDAI